jgi:hypothetical protein
MPLFPGQGSKLLDVDDTAIVFTPLALVTFCDDSLLSVEKSDIAFIKCCILFHVNDVAKFFVDWKNRNLVSALN